MRHATATQPEDDECPRSALSHQRYEHAIQWEYDLVEKPFCAQLKTLGWQWLEGDTDVPELTERESFREVLLKERLEATLRRLNLRDGQPWLDDVRIAHAIRALEQAPGHRLMDLN